MAQRHLARRLLRLGVTLRLQSSGTILNRSVVAICQRQQPQIPVQGSASIYTSVPRLSQNIINIQDEADFKTRVVESKTPVVIDFHAGWCGPCKLLGPRLESIIAERDGKFILAKVDIDDNADLAMSHGVQAVPTVLGMKDGKVVDKFVGLKDDAAISSFLDKLSPQ